jgi:hypothetical protein
MTMTDRGDDTGESPPDQLEDPEPTALGDAPTRAAIYMVAGCALLFSGVAFAFVNAATGAGVLIGGAIATLNLLVFARVGQAFLSRQGTVPWALVAVLKLVALFGGVMLILKSGRVSGVSLVAGYAAMPFGITLASLFGPRPGGDPGAPPKTESARRRDVIKGPRHGSDPPDIEP